MEFLTEFKLSKFVAGFDLAGERRSDGLLYPYGFGDTVEGLKEWPEKINFSGTVYNLEDTFIGNNGYECGEYA
jgi:hypothetical protein